ncbi:MAG: hypothetical protein LBT10_02000 [Methanobrevibacter sp.]|jgi:hypothetical protein|nr:hypothetical protein [Methanobrevibacter sp.]
MIFIVDSCKPGDNINLTFNVSKHDGQPIDNGDYNVTITEGNFGSVNRAILGRGNNYWYFS